VFTALRESVSCGEKDTTPLKLVIGRGSYVRTKKCHAGNATPGSQRAPCLPATTDQSDIAVSLSMISVALWFDPAVGQRHPSRFCGGALPKLRTRPSAFVLRWISLPHNVRFQDQTTSVPLSSNWASKPSIVRFSSKPDRRLVQRSRSSSSS
jgi:hypothetical protein